MRKFFNSWLTLPLILVSLSLAFYAIHYLIFRDLHHIFIYLIGDIAFLFIDVLIVILVLNRLLVYREKRSVLKKLNMVIGTFFSEVGTELLKQCSQFDSEFTSIRKQLVIAKTWTGFEFIQVSNNIKRHVSKVDSEQGDLLKTKDFLVSNRQFLLNLLGNHNLLEHESFTELLWAVFHLTEELAQRKDLKQLTDPDYQHLSTDIKRAYQQLILQWLDYMQHLQQDYPYLFSLALRTNPFDPDARIEVK